MPGKQHNFCFDYMELGRIKTAQKRLQKKAKNLQIFPFFA